MVTLDDVVSEIVSNNGLGTRLNKNKCQDSFLTMLPQRTAKLKRVSEIVSGNGLRARLLRASVRNRF